MEKVGTGFASSTSFISLVAKHVPKAEALADMNVGVPQFRGCMDGTPSMMINY
jgi:hypothetical protein